MAQDYVALNEKENNNLIAINKSVFESIAEISINDIENAIALKNTSFSKSIDVKVDDNKLFISTYIKVKYGANVAATCELVQNKIYENVLFMTGFKVEDINVNVVGFEI